MADVDSVKKATAEALNVSVDSLNYITAELIETQRKNEKLENKNDLSAVSGVYCHNLTIDSGPGGYLYYQRGPKDGTTNYGCGNDYYQLEKTGTTITDQGNCPDGSAKKLITW